MPTGMRVDAANASTTLSAAPPIATGSIATTDAPMRSRAVMPSERMVKTSVGERDRCRDIAKPVATRSARAALAAHRTSTTTSTRMLSSMRRLTSDDGWISSAGSSGSNARTAR